MKDFSKIVHYGSMQDVGNCFAKIEFRDGRLSICGVEGPLRNGNARGSCGQIIMGFKEYDHRGHSMLADVAPAKGWDVDKLRQFFDTWSRWHLNDLTAGSPAQEAYLRAHPITYSYPQSHYEEACKALAAAGLHPDPSNGYKYGSAWLREEVPDAALEFLRGLPDADITPAWV
jgi:hypothetical protein